MQAAFLRNMLPTRHLYRQNFCPNSAWRRRIVCWRNRCSLQPETFTAGESRGGCRSDLDIRQPPLGVLWLLSVATESNRIASAEATEAAKKVKSAIEVTQDTSPIPSHIPSATDEKTLSRLHLPRKCPIMKRTRETRLFSLRSGKRQRSCFHFEEKIRFRQSDHVHWAAHAPGRIADFGFAADGLAGVL